MFFDKYDSHRRGSPLIDWWWYCFGELTVLFTNFASVQYYIMDACTM